MPFAREAQGRDQGNDAPQSDEAHPEGDHVEGDDAGQLARLDAPAREHAVADGAPAQEGESHVVAEDEGDERRQRDPGVAEGVPDPAKGEGVVARQREIAARRQGEGESDPMGRNLGQVAEHVVVVVGGELVMQDGEGEREERDAEQRARRGEEPFLHLNSAPSRMRAPA